MTDQRRWFNFAVRVIAVLLAMVLGGCNGEAEETGEVRTSCEDQCWNAEFAPCNAECPGACEGLTGDDYNRCIDGCQGDCLTPYDACVASECGG